MRPPPHSPARPPVVLSLVQYRNKFGRCQKGALPYAEGMLEDQKKQKEAAEAAAAAGGEGAALETKKTK